MISDAEKERLIVGFKQALRAVKENRAAKIFLANDCESRISAPLEQVASAGETDIFYIDTMKELGTMCGIDVGASCAVVLK